MDYSSWTVSGKLDPCSIFFVSFCLSLSHWKLGGFINVRYFQFVMIFPKAGTCHIFWAFWWSQLTGEAPSDLQRGRADSWDVNSPVENSWIGEWDVQTYSPVIKRGNGKSTFNGAVSGEGHLEYKWWIFHCHVWLPEGSCSCKSAF